MRRSVSVTVKAGLALSLLVGFDQLVLSKLSAPSSTAVITRRPPTGQTTGRRTRGRTATTIVTPPTTLPTAAPTTHPADHVTTTSSGAPVVTVPATATTTASSTAPTTPTTTPTTAAPSTTATTHDHTPTGAFPALWTPSAGPRNGEAFVENFDADPTSPQPWQPDNWDLQFHNRDPAFWATPEPMEGHNSSSCGAAPAQHAISTWRDSTYVCLHHLMTAVKGSFYGAIYLTPPAMVDLSTQGTISWQNSTLLTSDRDWQDVWVTPFAENLTMPLYDWLPDLQGEPRTSIHVSRDFGGPGWVVNLVRNHVSTQIASLREPTDLPRTQAGVTTYEIRLSRTGLTFGLPERNLWVNASFADIGFTAGVVQFGHHSYTPEKNGGANTANSWSWDSFRISPTKPLTITHASPRLLSGDGAITFAAAPTNAFLRFSGVCTIEMDTGTGFKPVPRQAQEFRFVEHFASYFVPIPAGTTSAKFRFTGEGWYQGFPCAVRDAAVWTAA